MNNVSKMTLRFAIVVILVTGLIHVIEVAEAFEEAAYKGWLFSANGFGALVAAYGIYRNQRWGWNLGFLIAAGSLIGYVASRTVGLPQLPAEPDEWLEPLGVASLVVEVLFGMIFIKVTTKAKNSN